MSARQTAFTWIAVLFAGIGFAADFDEMLRYLLLAIVAAILAAVERRANR